MLNQLVAKISIISIVDNFLWYSHLLWEIVKLTYWIKLTSNSLWRLKKDFLYRNVAVLKWNNLFAFLRKSLHCEVKRQLIVREPARETENSSNKHKLLDINEALDWFSPLDDLYASANVDMHIKQHSCVLSNYKVN